jgi:PKD repeat protein
MGRTSRAASILRFVCAVSSLALVAACERHPLVDGATPDGPSLAREHVAAEGLGRFKVTGMNEAGDLVGYGERSYRWTRDGGRQEVSGVSSYTYVNGINESGMMVGTVALDAGRIRAAIWSAAGVIQVLPLPPGGQSMYGHVINDNGTVAGMVFMDTGSARLFRWTTQGGLEVSQPVGWSDRGSGTWYEEIAYDINSAGDIAGNFLSGCETAGGTYDCISRETVSGALLWKASGEAEALTDESSEQFPSAAFDITDSGRIGGCEFGAPVLWTRDGGLIELGGRGCVTAVNEAGVAVGTDWPNGGFRWTEEGGRESLGANLYPADINEHGEVTGQALRGQNNVQGFVWLPVSGVQFLPSLPGMTRSEGLFINDARMVTGISSSSSTYQAARWFDIVGNSRPVASIGGPYPTRIAGRRYVYSAGASTDVDGVVRYEWDMTGDFTVDAISHTPSIGYVHASPGRYTIRLVVRDDGGRADTAFTTVTVVANAAPVAAIAGLPDTVFEGQVIRLTADVTDASQAIDSTELSLMRYRWDWGDGYIYPARGSSHAYADQGQHVLRLVVTDAGGRADTVSRTVQVHNAPPRGRLTAPHYLREGTAFTLHATSLQDAAADLAAGLQLSFDCGEGGYTPWNDETALTCLAPPDEGTATVRLRVRDKDGDSLVIVRTLPVGNAAPQVSASADGPTTIAVGGSLTVRGTFTDAGMGDAWRYRIYWGDGNSTALTPVAGGATITGVHKYRSAGTYGVQIAVADEDGGSSRSVPITVIVMP